MSRNEIRSASKAPKSTRLPKALTTPRASCAHDGCQFAALDSGYCARHEPEPIAATIVRYAREKGLPATHVRRWQNSPIVHLTNPDRSRIVAVVPEDGGVAIHLLRMNESLVATANFSDGFGDLVPEFVVSLLTT